MHIYKIALLLYFNFANELYRFLFSGFSRTNAFIYAVKKFENDIKAIIGDGNK